MRRSVVDCFQFHLRQSQWLLLGFIQRAIRPRRATSPIVQSVSWEVIPYLRIYIYIYPTGQRAICNEVNTCQRAVSIFTTVAKNDSPDNFRHIFCDCRSSDFVCCPQKLIWIMCILHGVQVILSSLQNTHPVFTLYFVMRNNYVSF